MKKKKKKKKRKKKKKKKNEKKKKKLSKNPILINFFNLTQNKFKLRTPIYFNLSQNSIVSLLGPSIEKYLIPFSQ